MHRYYQRAVAELGICLSRGGIKIIKYNDKYFFFILFIYYIFIIIYKNMVITIQNINYCTLYVSQKTYLSNFINICQIDISVNM
jgi:hypothetical protein